MIWGIGLVVDASSRLALAKMLPTGTFIAVSPFITGSVLGSLVVFTVVYTKRTISGPSAATRRRRPPRSPATKAGPPRRVRRSPDSGRLLT